MNLYENTDPYGDPLSLDRLPLERNARLTSGNAWADGDYDPADITRSQARELAAALLAYADTPDPGPGAHLPSKWEFLAQQRVTAYEQQDVEEDGYGGWRPIGGVAHPIRLIPASEAPAAFRRRK